jgi:hypothetical protein
MVTILMYSSGGSLATALVTDKEGPFKDVNIHAAVRTEEQTKDAPIPGAHVLHLHTGNQQAVKDAILNNHSEQSIPPACCT